MRRRFIVLLLSAVLLMASSGIALSQSESKVTGFISATGGFFDLTFPKVAPSGQAVGEDVDFGDIYGSENGLSYGIEGGLGLGDIGVFGVLKYRIWKKHGNPVTIGPVTFDGDADWTQSFIYVGGRWFMVKPTRTSRAFLPFLGAGLVHSKVKEEMKGQAEYGGYTEYIDMDVDVDGTGFYIEGGADFFVASNVAMRGYVEYSSLNLGMSQEGVRAEIEGGGGWFLGVSLSMFFGKPMKEL